MSRKKRSSDVYSYPGSPSKKITTSLYHVTLDVVYKTISDSGHSQQIEILWSDLSIKIKMNKLIILLIVPCIAFVFAQALYPGAVNYGAYPGYYPVATASGQNDVNFLELIFFITLFAVATNLTGSLTG